MEKIRLSIAYEHPIFREGLALLLEDQGRLGVPRQISDGIEAVKLGRGMQLDVIIIDISMSYLSGIEAAKQIKAGSPDTNETISFSDFPPLITVVETI